MNWMKGFVAATCFAVPLAMAAATSAPAMPVGVASRDGSIVKVTAKMTPEQKMKAKQCSMEANAKKLHGDERYKFRAECMKK